jgi:hypothetical protein
VPRVFLSYAGPDAELAGRLARDLTARGVDVWLDATHLAPGQHWAKAIAAEIERCDMVVLLLTPSALRSPAVTTERQLALATARRVAPALAAGTGAADLPAELQHFVFADLNGDYNAGVAALARGIHAAADLAPAKTARNDQRLRYALSVSAEVADRLATASRQIDLATNSLGGMLSTSPPLLAEAALRGVQVRIVLPNPAYFADPDGGRLLELAGRAQHALRRLQELFVPQLALRLTSRAVPQTMLRIDDTLYLDPFPIAPHEQGLLVVQRSPAGPFTALTEEFEALFLSSLPEPSSTVDDLREQFTRLLQAEEGRTLERAAELYFRALGYNPTMPAESTDSGIDLIAYGPQTGLTVVQVKRSVRPLRAEVVARFIQAVTDSGADAGVLFSNQDLSRAGHEVLARAVATTALRLEVVTTAQALAAMSGQQPRPGPAS